MCLNTLEKFDVKQRIGYVIKIKEGNVYHSLYCHAPQIRTAGLKFGLEWSSKQITIICAESCDSYETGWHVFLKKKDAMAYRDVFGKGETVLMVRFRKILARGIEIFYPVSNTESGLIKAKVVISKYITLLKEIK
jgi:hypothetical protein